MHLYSHPLNLIPCCFIVPSLHWDLGFNGFLYRAHNGSNLFSYLASCEAAYSPRCASFRAIVPLHLWLLFLWLRLFSLSIQVLAPPSLFPICGTELHCHWHLRSFRVEILRSFSCLSLVSAFHSRASSQHCRGFPLHFYSGISLSEFSVITFFFLVGVCASYFATDRQGVPSSPLPTPSGAT